MEKSDFDTATKVVDYGLVHNIIYAAWEYAEDLGFKPHKDFTQITQYFLEEDNDTIELIDIECGQDGKPMFVQGPYDSNARAKQIVAQLEKSVGKDGYHYMLSAEPEAIHLNNSNEIDYHTMDVETLKELFFNQLQNLKNDISTQNKLERITDALYCLMVNDSEMVEYETRWKPENEIEISYNYYTPQMLGLLDEETISEENEILLNNILLEKNTLESLEKLKIIWGDFAFAAFADIKYLTKVDTDLYKEKLFAALLLYPGYALLQIEKYAYDMRHNVENVKEILFEKTFPGRKEISNYEMFNFQINKLNYFSNTKNLVAIEAMYLQIEEYYEDREMNYIETIKECVMTARIKLMATHLFPAN